MTKDLYEPKDQAWSFGYPAPGESIRFGEGKVYHAEATDVTVVSFANGVYMSLRAAKELKEKHGICARVVDLRWLNPLNEVFIAEQSRATGRVVIVDEGRRTGGVGEAILAVLQERCGGDVVAKRVAGADTYIPLGGAANLVLPQEHDIVGACRDVVGDRQRPVEKKKPTRTVPRG
jgi:2-oxoisovalerate dehydrogenase E1 component